MPIDVTKAPYGCDPTGLTDATAKLQAAINDVCAGGAQAGRTLDLGDGVYKVMDGGLVQPTNGLNMIGQRARLAHLTSTPTASQSTLNAAGQGALVAGLRCTGIIFDGGDGGTSSPYGGWGVSAGGFKDARFEDCTFKGYWGGALRGADAIDALRMYGCELTAINTAPASLNSSGSGLTGRFTNALLNGCWFHDMGTADRSMGSSWCVYFNGQSKNNKVVGCTFEDIAGAGISTAASSGDDASTSYDVTVQACTFERMSNQAAINGNATEGLIVAGNTFHNCNCVMYNVTDWQALGNTFVADTGRGMPGMIINTRNYLGQISNNNFFAAGPIDNQWGIQLLSGVEIDIINNRMTNCSAGVYLWPVNPGALIQNINILDNRITVGPGITQNYPHGSMFYGKLAGVLVNGACSGLRVRRNRVSGIDYDLAFANENGGAGQANGVVFEAEDPTRTMSQCIATLSGPSPAGLSVVTQSWLSVG